MLLLRYRCRTCGTVSPSTASAAVAVEYRDQHRDEVHRGQYPDDAIGRREPLTAGIPPGQALIAAVLLIVVVLLLATK